MQSCAHICANETHENVNMLMNVISRKENFGTLLFCSSYIFLYFQNFIVSVYKIFCSVKMG